MFTLYPLPCPAGYDLVYTGQQQGGFECQCEQNNQLIINCEDDQDSIIVEVNLQHHNNNILYYVYDNSIKLCTV